MNALRPASFHEGWTFRRLEETEAECVPVTIPHDAMRDEPRTVSNPGAEHTGWYAGRE